MRPRPAEGGLQRGGSIDKQLALRPIGVVCAVAPRSEPRLWSIATWSSERGFTVDSSQVSWWYIAVVDLVSTLWMNRRVALGEAKLANAFLSKPTSRAHKLPYAARGWHHRRMRVDTWPRPSLLPAVAVHEKLCAHLYAWICVVFVMKLRINNFYKPLLCYF